MSETCPILECEITLSNKFVTCLYCQYKACLNCNKYFILNSNTAECMNCKKVWNDDFIDTIFPKSFRKKEFKIHIENIMFEKQEAMFGETIEEINKDKKADGIKVKILMLEKQILEYKMELNNLYADNTQKNKEKNIIIIKKCPTDNCQGYLDRKYKCGICEVQICSKCENIKKNVIEGEEDEHVCNKDDVDTVSLKNKTSKPCPTCSKLTFKAGGCSQVWCPPPCNGGKGTSWNFNTGLLDKGAVHSPDYYDYMRKNGNLLPANNCRENLLFPAIWELQRTMSRKDFLHITDIHRFFIDLENNVMKKFEERNLGDFRANLDLRKLYLTNKLDKSQFKRNLFARNKKINKKKTIYENLDILYQVGFDIFNRLKYNHITKAQAIEELNNIRCYYNTIIKKTKDRYDCKSLMVSILTPDWVFKY